MNRNPDNKCKDKNTPVPLYITHPLPLGEKTSDAAEELAVRLAKNGLTKTAFNAVINEKIVQKHPVYLGKRDAFRHIIEFLRNF